MAIILYVYDYYGWLDAIHGKRRQKAKSRFNLRKLEEFMDYISKVCRALQGVLLFQDCTQIFDFKKQHKFLIFSEIFENFCVDLKCPKISTINIRRVKFCRNVI